MKPDLRIGFLFFRFTFRYFLADIQNELFYFPCYTISRGE